MTTGKVAVSLPEATLRRLELVRRRTGRSRSALVAEALERWLEDLEPSDEDRRYVEGYLAHPESAAEVAATAAAVIDTWEPWE
jgi:metal-responsive CopG/Arc/MetJ family transcriptional regulator